MDFLSAIPQPPKPLAPIGPGPDGTPPLPLVNPEAPVPARSVFPTTTPRPSVPAEVHQPEGKAMTEKTGNDIFDSDPFFNPEPQQRAPDSEEPPFDIDDIPADDLPVITLDPPLETDTEEPASITADYPPAGVDSPGNPATQEPEGELPMLPEPAPLLYAETPALPAATAEERLLNSIVSEPSRTEPDAQLTQAMAAMTSELAAVQALLESVQTERKSAISARDRARQDLQVLKTRFSTLESDLAAARAEVTKTVQQKTQAEARHADAERQWNDKLSQLRRMLDEVESIRDDLNNRRVPKILFIGVLIAGVLATLFAYFIGTRMAKPAEATPTEGPQASTLATSPAPEIPPVAPIRPDLPSPAPASLESSRPAHDHLPLTMPPATPAKPAAIRRTEPASPAWPALKGPRWIATRSGATMSVVFSYGLFTEGTELSATARQDLKTLATALQGSAFTVEVEGHTDSAQVKRTKTHGADNKALGLNRAKAAAAFLTQQAGLAADQVTTSSAGESDPPYPNTTPESRKKNRTVVLKIKAAP